MSELSEEEIIKTIKNMLEHSETQLLDYEALALQGLLDLYQKEKEKNKELIKPKYILNSETGEITKLDNDLSVKIKIRKLIDKINIDGYSYQDCIGEIIDLLEERN